MTKNFRVLFVLFITLITTGYFSGCKKSDIIGTPTTGTFVDTGLSIISTNKTDVNEFDLAYQVNPNSGKNFSNSVLYFSTNENFASKDSVLISAQISQSLSGTKHLSGLKQNTTYYCKLTAVQGGNQYNSSVRSFKTDSLKIMYAFGLDTFPILVNRNFDQNSIIFTNFSPSSNIINPDTSKVRIFLGTHECQVTSDQGNNISFHVPENIPPDSTYSLRLFRKGISVTTVQGLYVAKGVWYSQTAPDIPFCNNCGYMQNGIGYFGTCQSSDKGYMVGGIYYHSLGIIDTVNHPDSDGPYSVRVFDGNTQQWSEIMPSNPRMYNNAICYYYNNSIYVIGGQLKYPNDGPYFVNTMWRMDLGTNSWIPVGQLPYEGEANQVSFELNGEWYIGMGLDSIDIGNTAPNKKFWKYTPTTNTWTRLADFPGAGNESYPTGFTINNQAYVFYGALITGQANYTSDYSQELWKYDPASNSWTQIPIPVDGPPPGEKYQIISYNGKAYFLNAQVRIFMGNSYGFQLQIPALEWDPVSNTYSRVSNAINSGIQKLIFSKGDKFYFQSDAIGYLDNIENVTSLFIPDR